MRHLRRAACALLVLLAVAAPAAAAPEGQLTWGVHISLAPTWFDPAETLGIITPFMVMYAIHDALAKAMPGNPAAPSLAESWQVSPDGRVYDFTLRKGVKFHNGDTLTSEDVKFSFERYKGTAATTLNEREAAGLQGHLRRGDPAGRVEARRGRHRVLDPRRARGRDAAHARAHAEGHGDPGPAVGQHAGPVGPEVALARPAGAPGGQPRDRPQGHQPGDHARPLQTDVQHHPQHVRFLLAAAPL